MTSLYASTHAILFQGGAVVARQSKEIKLIRNMKREIGTTGWRLRSVTGYCLNLLLLASSNLTVSEGGCPSFLSVCYYLLRSMWFVREVGIETVLLSSTPWLTTPNEIPVRLG